MIAVMPKAKGDPYFVSCRAGAEEAARELGVDLIWDGPTSLDAAKQNELVENWITRKVDAIAVAVENRGGISTVLRKARERGIRVLTWDADAEPDARDFFVNQATAEGIANALTDEASRLLGGTGRVRDHHRRAQRREPERMDRLHQEAARRQASRAEAGDDPPERRRPGQGVCRDADAAEGVSGGEAGDGDLRAGGARRRRGGAAGRPQGRQRDRAVAAEHQQAVRPRRRRADGRALEHARSRIPRRLCERPRHAEQARARRAHADRPGGSDRSRCATARSSSARRCCSTRATSIGSIFSPKRVRLALGPGTGRHAD